MIDPLTALPADIAVLVFRKISLREIARCMSVSKRWCRLLENQAVLWGNVDMGGALGKGAAPLDSRLEMGFNHEEETNDSDSDSGITGKNSTTSAMLLYDENLKTIARRAGPAMWRVALRFSPLISDIGIRALLDSGCTNLRHLEIRANRKISNDVFKELVKNVGGRLEYVALSTTEVCDRVVQLLLCNAPNLVHLDLSFCRYITADSFPVANGSNFVFSSTSDPESDVAEAGGTEDSNIALDQQPVTEADAQANKHRHPVFQVDAKTLPRLQTLLLDGCVDVYNAAVPRVLNAFGKSLRTLDLSRTKVTMWTIQQIAASIHKPLQLEHLLMNGISIRMGSEEEEAMLLNDWLGISTPIVEGFIASVLNLRRLKLGGGNNLVTNSLVSAVARSCRRLVSLDVHDSLRLGAQSMLVLGEFCTNLTQLNLSGCIGCQDEGIIGLVNGCRKLEALDLSTLNITDESLRKIGSLLYKLERLFLDFCRLITDDGIKAVVAPSDGFGCMVTLRKLSFIQCRKVNDGVAAWCKARLHPSAIVMYRFSQRR
ncbi:hypothetical protein H4R99_003892 [Coemansia sp. RSA 1722]|nr:hypothetical protein H4R99_003892 [Coemansia sp. RSA 1722]